jgi:hypothetical protein
VSASTDRELLKLCKLKVHCKARAQSTVPQKDYNNWWYRFPQSHFAQLCLKWEWLLNCITIIFTTRKKIKIDLLSIYKLLFSLPEVLKHMKMSWLYSLKKFYFGLQINLIKAIYWFLQVYSVNAIKVAVLRKAPIIATQLTVCVQPKL